MMNRLLFLSFASLALAACVDPPFFFEDIEGEAWVNSSGKPGGMGDDYGVALIPASSSGFAYWAFSKDKPSYILGSFDDKGKGTDGDATIFEPEGSGRELEALGDQPVTALGSQNFAIGAFGNATPYIYLRNAESGASVKRISLVDGGGAPSGVAFGDTDIGAGEDIVATVGNHVHLISAAELSAGADNLDSSLRCDLGGASGAVFVADVDAAPGNEILVAVDGEIRVLAASTLDAANTADEPCFMTTPALASIAAPDGEGSFGDFITSGDFDGNGEADLVVAAPADNAVYVFPNWSVASASAGEKVDTPSGSVEFGVAVATGDFNDDGQDELVIGDPGISADSTSRAGTAYLFEAQSSGGFATPLVLHDAQPEKDQKFGQSIAVVNTSQGDQLVVGAKDEIFTYFLTPVEDDKDFRQ